MPTKKQSASVTPLRGAKDIPNLESAFRLMGAVPFTRSKGDKLSFALPEAAAHLLKNHQADLPTHEAQWLLRLSAKDIAARRAALRRLTWDGAQYAVRYQLRLDTGEMIWIEEMGERLSGVDAAPTEITGVFRSIDRAQDALETAAYKARYDSVSGLMNAASFETALGHVCALTERQNGTAAMLRLRAGNLADINAVYGYETGDLIIKLIGQRLAGLVRAPDHIAKLEGADFGLCVIDADEAGLAALLARMEDPLRLTPYATPHGGLKIDFHIGAAMVDGADKSAAEIIGQTETVLGKLKSKAGWAANIYSPDMDAPKQAPIARETEADDIIAALNERRISLAYQPIIDARTRDLHHYECLLRLRREDGEIVSAGRVIMSAEKLGLVNLLDRRALEIAAETLRAMPDVHLALNVSAATLKNDAAVEDYLAALKALGPDAQRVTLELTETAALDDPGLASFFSVETRKLGCDFAIDDFGSGYTTFRNLMAIEADSIKIDGSYIQGIAREPYKETFVRMMVDLAQTFSVKTVAEMVDSRADAELLRRLGVDYLQGYMFGIPSAAPDWRRHSA